MIVTHLIKRCCMAILQLYNGFLVTKAFLVEDLGLLL